MNSVTKTFSEIFLNEHEENSYALEELSDCTSSGSSTDGVDISAIRKQVAQVRDTGNNVLGHVKRSDQLTQYLATCDAVRCDGSIGTRPRATDNRCPKTTRTPEMTKKMTENTPAIRKTRTVEKIPVSGKTPLIENMPVEMPMADVRREASTSDGESCGGSAVKRLEGKSSSASEKSRRGPPAVGARDGRKRSIAVREVMARSRWPEPVAGKQPRVASLDRGDGQPSSGDASTYGPGRWPVLRGRAKKSAAAAKRTAGKGDASNEKTNAKTSSSAMIVAAAVAAACGRSAVAFTSRDNLFQQQPKQRALGFGSVEPLRADGTTAAARVKNAYVEAKMCARPKGALKVASSYINRNRSQSEMVRTNRILVKRILNVRSTLPKYR